MAKLALMIAAFVALVISALSGCVLVPWLRKLKCGQITKEIDLPARC